MARYEFNVVKDSTGVANITLNPSGIPTFGGGIAQFTYAAGSLNETIGNTVSPIRFYTPTADTDFVKLNTTWTTSQVVKITNKATTKILLVKANDDSIIATLYPQSSCEIIPNAATPGATSAWEGLNPIVSGWADESSKFSTGGATTTVKSVFTKRIGDSYHVNAYFLFSTSPASAATVGWTGPTIDLTKILNDSAVGFQTQTVGSGVVLQSTGGQPLNSIASRLFIDASSTTAIFSSTAGSSPSGFTATNFNGMLNTATDGWAVSFIVPISTWTSTKG